MKTSPPTRPLQPDSEAGYMLVAVIVMVTLILIGLSLAAPVVAKNLRREKEVESEHRAQEYVRAIRLYYRKTKSYPPSIDALKNTNNVRFLRQEYVDPLTGKSDWRIIHLGEQKTTIKGFFGQELGGIASSGLGSAAGMGSGIGSPIGGSSGSTSTSTVGATSPLASGFQDASITTSTAGTAGAFGSSGATGSTGSSGFGGGGAIIGVGTAKTGESISTPNKQSTYETWEFWYDPRIEVLYQKGKTNAGIGTGAVSSQPASSFGSGSGFGSSGFGGSSGATSSTGSTGTSPGSSTNANSGGPL